MATKEELISILESRGFERNVEERSRHFPAEYYSLAHPDESSGVRLDASATHSLLLETRAAPLGVASFAQTDNDAYISVEVHEFSLLSSVFLENILDTVISEFVEAGKDVKKKEGVS